MTKRDGSEVLSYRVPDIVRATGLSVSSVKRLIKTRQLPSLRVGKCRLVRRRDLEKFLESRVDA
jgi:excisionase family DNA binding protein